MKFFDDFADNRFGSWVINGLAVVAFIIALKVLLMNPRVPDSGPLGAIKAGVALI